MNGTGNSTDGLDGSFKYQHKYIKYGVQNLYKWFWIIWKDRDWDHHYIFEVLKFN